MSVNQTFLLFHSLMFFFFFPTNQFILIFSVCVCLANCVSLLPLEMDKWVHIRHITIHQHKTVYRLATGSLRTFKHTCLHEVGRTHHFSQVSYEHPSKNIYHSYSRKSKWEKRSERYCFFGGGVLQYLSAETMSSLPPRWFLGLRHAPNTGLVYHTFTTSLPVTMQQQ